MKKKKITAKKITAEKIFLDQKLQFT